MDGLILTLTRKVAMRYVLALALVLLPGCASTIVKDLAADHSTLCVKGTYTIMASVTVLRSNVSGQARCAVDDKGNMILEHAGK